MGFVADTLEEFQGQLSINDIYNMTYKELGYLRKRRADILKAKEKAAQIDPKTLMP
jgi:hypothetical protein